LGQPYADISEAGSGSTPLQHYRPASCHGLIQAPSRRFSRPFLSRHSTHAGERGERTQIALKSLAFDRHRAEIRDG